MTRLLRVTAYVLRFLRNVQNSSNQISGYLTSSELKEAEKLWLKYVQRNAFSEVFLDISAEKSNNLQRQLGLYIDEDSLLRCCGRLKHAELSFGAIRPLLLPKNNHFTEVIINKIHKELLHSGVSQTLSKIRYCYWIIRGRATVKSVLSKCGVCRRVEGGAYKMPRMPPLP